MRRTFVPCLVIFALGVATLGCSPSRTITVRLQTDLAPGVEFDEVVVTGPRAWRTDVEPTDSFVEPAQVASYDGVAPGTVLQLELSLRLEDRVVLLRRIARTVQNDGVILVILSRNCLELSCPSPTAPMATECRGRVCVTPECDDATGCGTMPECTSDADCGAPEGCVTPRCVSGLCLSSPDSTSCGALRACVPGTGCVDVGPSPRIDAGAADADLDAPEQRDARDTWSGSEWSLFVLPPGATEFTRYFLPGTVFVDAAFHAVGSSEVMVIANDGTLRVLRITDRMEVARIPLSTVFPGGLPPGGDITAATMVEGQLWVFTMDGALHRYTWDDGARRASFVSTTSAAELLAGPWGGPLAPSPGSLHAAYTAPDNVGGWSTTDVSGLCGRPAVELHVAFGSGDSADPTRSLLDLECDAFVSSEPQQTTMPFSFPGPGGEYVNATDLVDGALWVFTSTPE